MNRAIKMVIMGGLLFTVVLSSTGCAAAWFLAGAGTAATVITASGAKDSASKATQEKDEE